MKRALGAVVLALALAGCSTNTDVSPVPLPLHLEGDLVLELHDSVHVVIDAPAGSDASARDLTVTLTPSAGYGFFAGNTKLSGAGRIEPFPEAASVLYTAKLGVPAASGPCGAKPVSLALSLHRKLGANVVVGGLSAYCGEKRWHGTPARVLRMSGSLSGT